MTTQYIPDLGIFQGRESEWADNSVWIEITPRKLTSTQSQQSITVELEDPDEDLLTYAFLAPRDMQETLNHSWEPLENIAATIGGKLSGVGNALNQGNNVFKVDTPLLYKDSQRRVLTFMFHLAYSGKNEYNSSGDNQDVGPYREVVQPVKNFLKWSSPSLSNVITNSTVDLPYVFTIRTKAGDGTELDIFNIHAAALTSVQPTFSQPYIQGYPAKAELTLTFTDIEPLNRATSLNRDISVN